MTIGIELTREQVKTALAEYLQRQYFKVKPEVLDWYTFYESIDVRGIRAIVKPLTETAAPTQTKVASFEESTYEKYKKIEEAQKSPLAPRPNPWTFWSDPAQQVVYT